MFKVGEVLIVREDSDAHPAFKGLDVLVTEVSNDPFFFNDVPAPYKCRFFDGVEVWGCEHQLRRKKPPTEYKGEQEILSLFKVKPREVCDAG